MPLRCIFSVCGSAVCRFAACVSFLPVTVVFCRTAGKQRGLATPYERRIIKADHHEGGMQDEKIYSYSRKSEERRQQ